MSADRSPGGAGDCPVRDAPPAVSNESERRAAEPAEPAERSSAAASGSREWTSAESSR